MSQDRWIWEAFDQLIKLAWENPDGLRKCQMPRGKYANHMNYVLGGREEDVPLCGRFYVGSAEWCGYFGCWKSHTSLCNIESWQEQARKVKPIWYQNEVQAYDFLLELWQRAEQLATQHAQDGAPRQLDVLFQFEELIKLESTKTHA